MISRKAAGVSPSPTLAIDAKFKEMKANGEDVVGFGCGEPDFDTPEHIKQAAIEAIKNGETKYTPAAGTLRLRKAVANKFLTENGLEYQPSDIVVSNGAKHSILNAFTAICNPGDEVIIPAPYWVSYPEIVKLCDGVPVTVNATEENDFKVTRTQLEEVLTPKTKAIVINSPSNPTGMVYTEAELKAIADFAVEHNLYVVSDEIYEYLIYEGKHVSIASFGDKIKDLTIVVNGVSKTFAMTGWRIGYAAANPEIAKAMASIQSHASSNPNSIAQAATVAALEGGMEEVEKMRKQFKRRRDFMVDMFSSIDGISCRRPHGAFYIMMNIEELIGSTMYGTTIRNADDFAKLFLDVAKVAVVPGTGFGAENYVRWSYATSMDNIVEGVERLKTFLHAADL